jgi:hypothetical protein
MKSKKTAMTAQNAVRVTKAVAVYDCKENG